MQEVSFYNLEQGKEYYIESVERGQEKTARYIGAFHYIIKELWYSHQAVFYKLTPIRKGHYGYPQRNAYIWKDSHKYHLKQKEVIEMKVTNRILQSIIGDPNFYYY
jgi:hypothetical protein